VTVAAAEAERARRAIRQSFTDEVESTLSEITGKEKFDEEPGKGEQPNSQETLFDA